MQCKVLLCFKCKFSPLLSAHENVVVYLVVLKLNKMRGLVAPSGVKVVVLLKSKCVMFTSCLYLLVPVGFSSHQQEQFLSQQS